MVRKPPRSGISTSRRPGSRAAMPPRSPPYCRTRSACRRLPHPATFSNGVNGYSVRCRRWADRKCWMISTPIRRAAAETQDYIENAPNFEYRPVLNAGDAGAMLIDAGGQRAYAVANTLEGIEHHSHAAFLHPRGVVAFL